MLPLAAAALLAQAPPPAAPAAATVPVVVVLARDTGLEPVRAESLARDLSPALALAGIAVAVEPDEAKKRLAAQGVGEPTECRGRAECLARLGEPLQASAVVAIDVGEAGGDIALYLEALEVAS